MEFFVIAALVGLMIYVVARAVLRSREQRQIERQLAIEEAWRIVLSDPNYEHRRNYAERLRRDEAAIRRSEGLPPRKSN